MIVKHGVATHLQSRASSPKEKHQQLASRSLLLSLSKRVGERDTETESEWRERERAEEEFRFADAMVWPMDIAKGWSQDLQCLTAMWLRGVQGQSHKERLEFFYGPQAHACE